jgi:PAS domain S-box-containing protein
VIVLQGSRDKNKQLKRDQEKFAKAFLENSTPMSITAVKDGRIIDLSDAFLELVGLERHELIGRTTTGIGFITAAQRGMLLNEIKQHGRVTNLELPIKMKGGELGHVLINSSIISIDGEDYLLSVFTDITKRRKTEAALLASEKRYRTVYENTTLGIYETTPAGKLIHANQTFAGMFGFSSSEDVICELTDLARQIYVDPRQRTEIIQKALDSDIPQRFETEYRRRDGSTFTAILEIQAVWSEENNEFHLFGFVEDISQRKQAEERQRIAEELYRTLAEKSFAGVYVVQNGRFMFINTNAAQYAGYAKEELLGRLSESMIHPEDRESAGKYAVEMLRGKRDAPYEFRIVTRQGENRWIMETVSSINYLGTPAILGNSMDITKYKSIAAERENIILQLQKALLEVKRLSGLLPICSSCKKIRNDEGYWEQVEVYIRDRSEAEFSHGICPACANKLYPEIFKDEGQI